MVDLGICVKEYVKSYCRSSNVKQLVREEKKVYISHDQLFKELIGNYFEEFMEVFFPEQHSLIDFLTITPLSEEIFTDLIKGENRRVDLLIEAKLKGEDTLIIVHVEPQSSYQDDFHKRMYLYFNYLYQKYRKPILPIAVFTYDYQRTEQQQFNIKLPNFHVLSFNFLVLELKKKNWREYLRLDNPVAAALLSKMGYKESEKVEVKKAFLRMMIEMNLNPADTRFITSFFDQYLILNDREEEKLMEEISQLDNAEEFFELSNSWEDRGIRKGKKEGIKEGKKEGKKEGIEQVVIEMLKEGSTFEFIEKVTKLDREAIIALQRKIKK